MNASKKTSAETERIERREQSRQDHANADKAKSRHEELVETYGDAMDELADAEYWALSGFEQGSVVKRGFITVDRCVLEALERMG
ncbi:MAG: hypothetical protein GY841_02905 [FCB group bacterium]|nr:hypothetical protein [FCB group bacterium]